MALLGPIFSVELITSARRTRYFVVRVAYAAILLFVLWSNYASLDSRDLSIAQSTMLTDWFFNSFAFLQMATLLIVGPAMAAGTIAVERERRTIEYLFASDLTNREIVLDKLAARLLLIAYLVLVGLPILVIFRLLGGISAALLVMVFVITVSTMISVAAISVCVSVWSPRALDGVTRTYLILIAALVVPMLIYVWIRSGVLPATLVELVKPVNDWLLDVNPIWVLRWAISEMTTGSTSASWERVRGMVLGQLTVSVGMVALASLAVRWVHLRTAGRSARRSFRLGKGLWQPKIGNDPMIWKELFAHHAATKLGLAGSIALALIIAVVFGSTLWIFIECMWDVAQLGFQPSTYFNYLGVTGPLLAVGILLVTAARASGTVSGEHERNCWDSLLSTPLTGKQIVLAKVWGNLYVLRWLMGLLMFIWALACVIDAKFILVTVFLAGTLAILAVYLTALGVLYSLVCKTTLRAMGATMATALFFGGGYLFTCCIPFLNAPGGEQAFILAPCIPFLLTFPYMVYFQLSHNISFNNEPSIVTAYFFGLIGYAVAAVTLIASAVVNFERLAGRVHQDLLKPEAQAKE